MKYIIVGGEFNNKGAEAMVFSAISQIRKKDPCAEIVIFDANNYNPYQDDLNAKYFYFPSFYYSKIIGKGKWAVFLLKIKNIIKKILGKSTVVNLKECLNHLRTCDYFIDISGYALSTVWGANEVNDYLNKIRYISRCNEKAKIVLMPQSFGPIDFHLVKKEFVAESLSKCFKIFARERIGYELLKEIGLQNVSLEYDSVLLSANDNYKEALKNYDRYLTDIEVKGQKNIAIVPNLRLCDKLHISKEELCAFYFRIMDQYLASGYRFYLVGHAREDLRICKIIKNKYADHSAVILIDQVLTSYNYQKFISAVDFVIASRYHSLIHAYKEFIPAIILGWSEKYEAIAKALGQERYLADLKNVADTLSKIDFLIANRSDEVDKIRSGVEEIQKHDCYAFIMDSPKKIEIREKAFCSGCTACSSICPKKCIEMRQDEEGFFYPSVNTESCVECSLCVSVCPMYRQREKSDEIIHAYVGSALDQDVLMKCSSGGLAYLISKHIANTENGVVYGAVYDDRFSVIHQRLTKENVHLSVGSKYSQSNLDSVFPNVKTDLDRGNDVLFIGTECQVSGLKAYLKKDYGNLFTIDLLCHGVPTPKLITKYIAELENKHHSKLVELTFRAKRYDWLTGCVYAKFSDGSEYTEKRSENDYMRLFLNDICLRPSCHDCPFKSLNRESDITLGDAWSVEEIYPELYNKNGNSLILTHTEKGESLLKSIGDEIALSTVDVDLILPKTADPRRSVRPHKRRAVFFRKMEKRSVSALANLVEPTLCERAINKFRKMMKKLHR